jgi:hypothetical protein
MKLLRSSIVIVLIAFNGFAQKNVSVLEPSHAAALQKYLAAEKGVYFLQEHAIDDETLAEMRMYFGRRFKPYYLAADFNHDRVRDFALILSRAGKPTFDDEEEAAARIDDRNLRLVIFNGDRKGFYVAHVEDIEAPPACFINLSDGKKKTLYFGVYGSDADTFGLAPAGKGYIMEFDKPR